MAMQNIADKILWLASYPKSGNTWFRAFLTALMNEGKVEINAMETDGIFSDRFIFDYVTEIESRDLYDEEAKQMVADVYRYLALEREKLNIIKIHDAFETDQAGQNLVPEDATHCALYFIRNPLDIAGSLANHNHSGIREAVDMLNNTGTCLAWQPKNLNKNPQFRIHLSDWSGHVNSWTLLPPFPVCVIRYEDMLGNPFETFYKATRFIGWDHTPEQISRAIAASSFDKLKSQEAEKGFNEKNRKSPEFFRSGTMGNWEKELTAEQINEIRKRHEEVMRRYNYLV